jgi:hypothetical protein
MDVLMREDRGSHTEADAAAHERAHAEPDNVDRPDAADLLPGHPKASATLGAEWLCRRGCRGWLWSREDRDRHEEDCDGKDPWSLNP